MTATLRSPNRHRALVATLSLVHGFTFYDRLLIALLAPALKVALGLSDAALGVLQGSAFVPVYAFVSVMLAVRSRTVDRIALLIAGFVVSSLAAAACGLASSFVFLFVMRAAMGAGQAAVAPMALSLLADRVPPGGMGRATSLFTAGAALGRSMALLGGSAFLAAVAVPLLGGGQAWRGVFLSAIVPVPVLITLLLRSRSDAAVVPSRLQQSATVAPSLRRWLVRNRRFAVTHGLASSATVLLIQTLTAWATSLLVRRHGFSVAGAGAVFGAIVLVCAPVGHIVGGVMLDTASRRIGLRAPGAVMAGALLVAACSIGLLVVLPARGMTLAMLAVATLVLGVAAPAGYFGVQAVSPPLLRRRTTALFISAVTLIGFGLGPASLGVLTDRVLGPGGIATALFVVASFSAFCTSLAAILQAPIVSKGRDH